MKQESRTNINRVKKDISSPDSFTPPEELKRQLITTMQSIYDEEDIEAVERAYKVAYKAHEKQKRKSGEPYIIHPICVAIILAELELDKETIMAGLLHDVVEDTETTHEDIVRDFGEEVAQLVDGVTKLGQLSYSKDKIEVQAENLRKMFLAMAKDIRVILIKLADRLHNMRTMQFMRPEKQKEKSRETMDIYAPIAHRLGISKIKVELDDLALRYLKPDVYEDLERSLDSAKEEREAFIQEIVDEVKGHIDHAGIKAEIDGRVKHMFSIYKKMVNQHKTIDQIYDLFAVRIKVDTVKDCYAALGIIHEMYKPIPGRFKDYIAMPKPNMYQSLHTTLIGPEGHPFEIQIRTFEMHRTAEYGIAAHWKYKERGSGDTTVRDEEAKLSWLRQILEWQKDVSDNKEFISMVKNDLDLFSDNVYCFTPQGDVKNLPAGSTPIDFAYSIHSAVGNRMKQAAVNGKMVPLDYKIQNGDRIEIFTSQNVKGPSRDWLNIAKSTQAKNKINQWFKQEGRAGNITRGKELVASCAKGKGFEISDLTKPEFTKKVVTKYGFRDWDSILAAVGHGGLKEGQIVNKLIDLYQESKKKAPTDEQVLASVIENNKNKPVKIRSTNGVLVNGVVDVNVRFSRCCSPVPGDEIVGFITRGRGISIHRTDCVNVIALPESEKSRLVDVEWQQESFHSNEKFMAEIKIFCNNRIGIFADISKIFTEREIDIASMSSKTSKQGTATINMSFEVGGVDALQQLINRLMAVNSVIDIERSNG